MRQGRLNVATCVIVNGRLGSRLQFARVDLRLRRGRHQSEQYRRLPRRSGEAAKAGIQKRLHESFSLEKDVGTKDRFYPGILTAPPDGVGPFAAWREVA